MPSQKKKEPSVKRKPPFLIVVRWRLEAVLGRFIFWLARRISRNSALRLADFLGIVLFRCFRKYRMVCTEGIKIAFGDKYSESERLELAKKSQTNLVRTVMDFLKFDTYTREEFLALAPVVKGLEHLEKATEKSKGGIIGLAAHLGGWEYGGAWLVASGWNLSAVGKEQRDPGITRIMLQQRAAAGIKHIPRSKAGNVELIRSLRTKKTVIGLLIDQNAGWEGVFVDFFGVPASSVRGPAFLALKYGIPVIPIFSLWDGDLYRVEILPEIELIRTGDEERDILENTRVFQKMIEDMVRKYPEQWLWAHRRWNTRPPGEPKIYHY